jgi:glycosyltransferase involved in cell wall biosynthesis
LGIDDSAPVLVYAGSLYESKYDIETLLNAFAELTADQAASLYIVGGDDKEVAKHRAYAETVCPPDSFQFTGHVSQRRVFEYLKAADIGVVAQQPTDINARKYTSPLKLFEYLVSGLVVVATDVPSISEVAEGEPRIFSYDPGNSDSLSETLARAVEQYPGMQTDGPGRRYSYEYRAERIRSVLETTL